MQVKHKMSPMVGSPFNNKIAFLLGVIAARLSQSPLSALRDSFAVVRYGLNFLETLEEPLMPPQNCTRDGIQTIWTERQAPQFLK